MSETIMETEGCTHHMMDAENAVITEGICPLCLCDQVRSLRTEVREREANIEWWRERYNNLVELNGRAIDGRLESDDDVFTDKTEYPLSHGAKTALYKIIEAVRVSGK